METSGALVFAYHLIPSNAEAAAVTVNTVSFQPLAFPISGHVDATASGVLFHETDEETNLFGKSGLDSACAPFSSLSSAYRALLSSGGTTVGESYENVELTMSNLTVGHSYHFQWWMNDSSGTDAFMAYGDDGRGNIIDLTTGNGNGALGQFGIGTFTATETSQLITFYGDYDEVPLINAFQLRDLSAIPESSVYAALVGAGALAAAQVRRRKRLA